MSCRIMKKLLSYKQKKRAVSPVIATVLLIGLVVIAGLGVALVMFGTINAPDPLKIEVISISSFETTDGDYNVDRFDITLYNNERTNARIEMDAFSLQNFSDQTEIPGWEMDIGQSEIIIPALTIQTITLACDNTQDEFELEPMNTTIYIDVTAYPADDNNPRSAKTFRSDILTIGDTYGPVSLSSFSVGSSFDQSGFTLNFSVTNNGSSDLDLRLDFTSDSFGKIFYKINGVNSTSHSFILNGFKTTIFPNTLFQINATSLAAFGESYLVLVTLWDNENMNLLATEALLLAYEP
ncbi:MAG: type IV pilin N-terminal domain-containing protein [Candidatus Hodarchaeales archaeon]